MNHKKVYVEVTASFRPDGVILPREAVLISGSSQRKWAKRTLRTIKTAFQGRK